MITKHLHLGGSAAQVIKLSDAIQPLPRSVTQFVHGVAKPFLATGERLAARRGQSLSMFVDGSETQANATLGAIPSLGQQMRHIGRSPHLGSWQQELFSSCMRQPQLSMVHLQRATCTEIQNKAKHSS